MRRRSSRVLVSWPVLCLGAAAVSACGEGASRPAATPPEAPTQTATEPAPAAPAAATPAAPARGLQGGGDDWRAVVSAEDAVLLGKLDQAWSMARARADGDGFADEVEALGVLVDPKAGQQGRLQPAPGGYRCRTIKLGARGAGGPAFVAYPYFRCRVELTPGGDLILEKTTGSQRVKGLLYPDTERRLVYVGTQAWGDERGFPAYGAQPDRDQAGVFERIGPERWRLVIPFPKQESQLDIIEVAR